MNPDEAEYPLIFPARRVSRRVWTLLVLLLVSLLAHALSFYILQVAYTPTVTLPPPPAELTLLAPASAENKALNRWLAMADPALMTQPSSEQDALAALPFRYIPSYAAAPPAYRPLDLTPAPSAPAAGDLFGSAPLPPLPPANRPPVPSPASRLTLDPALTALLPQPLAPIRISLRTAGAAVKPMEPSVFLVGVRPEGGTPFIFRQGSSGNAAVDDYAREYLARLAFTPAPPTGAWGFATFYWGMDVFR